LRFDLTRTRLLSTAGIGVMLHIRSDYQLAPGHAVIEYQDPQVGELLLLSGMQRCFVVRHQTSFPIIAAPQRQFDQIQPRNPGC
jgi:anti-anti-sigma regulatory factor